MKIAACILALALTLAVTVANAADWSVVTPARDEAVYFDRASVHQSGSVKEAWVLHSYHQTQTLGDAFAHKSKLILYAFRCDLRQAGYSQWTFKSGELGSGSTVWASHAAAISFFPADNDPAIAGVMARIC